MMVYSYKNLENFDAWGGACNTKKEIIDSGKEMEFMELIRECYPNGIHETTLNDILAFEWEWLYDSLGMEND